MEDGTGERGGPIINTHYTLYTYTHIFDQKRNVRLKIVASGCDQCMWPVGVVVGYGH